MKFNHGFILKVSFISALGGYLFGFDFAVIAGALPFLQQQFHLDPSWEGFATGSLALGAILGCLTAGSVGSRYGRRKGLLLAATIFGLSSLAMALASGRLPFVLARFIAGAGVGMASMLSPMYIAEIAPAPYRGTMVSINQLTVVIGILITNLVNYSLRAAGPDAWRWMFGLGAVPSLLFLIGAYFLPESPRWLLQKGQEQAARSVLTKIGPLTYVEQSVTEIKHSLLPSKAAAGRGVRLQAFWPILLVGISLAAFQQLCGINTVFNYAPKLFESIGASTDDQLLQTVFIGGVNLVFTLLAMVFVDKIGRKPLMLLGAGGLAILYLLIVQLLAAGDSRVAWLLLSAIGLYAMTLAPVTWVLIAEIFPAVIRDRAMVISIVSLWAACFVLVYSFPVLFDHLKDHTFYIYAAICALGFFFILTKVKETKGKTLEEM